LVGDFKRMMMEETVVSFGWWLHRRMSDLLVH
jgi:hypothetical protein